MSVSDPTSARSSSLVYPHPSPSKIISVQEAVYGVAIAEEEDVVEDVRERELEEETTALRSCLLGSEGWNRYPWRGDRRTGQEEGGY